MTTLNFNKLSVKNFLSFGAQTTEMKLDSLEKISVIAPNGTGKTALFVDSIFFALYGSTFRDIKKKQIPNQINRNDCLVTLDIDVNGTPISIKRGIAPDVFEIEVDGEQKCVDLSVSDKQRYLNEKISVTKVALSQIIFIGADHQPFLAQTPATRREFIEQILDLSVYSDMNAVAKSIIKRMKSEASDISYEISKNDAVIESKNFVIANIKQKDVERIKKAEGYIEKISVAIESLSDKSGHLKSLIDENNTKLSDLRIELTVEKKNLSDVEEKNRLIDSGKCPTCGSDLHGTDRIDDSDFKKRIEDLEEEIKRLNTIISDDGNKLREINDKITEYRDKKNNAERFIASENASVDDSIRRGLENEIDDLVINNAVLQEQLDELTENLDQYIMIQKILAKGDAKRLIIDQFVPFFNMRINEYLDKMDFRLLFEFDSDFNETMRSRYRDVFSYDNFSAGEKARIDTALLLTWRDVAERMSSLKTNLLILDEFGSKLDEDGKRYAKSIISKINNTTVFTILPLPNDHVFDKQIRLEKVQNFSLLK